MALLILIVVVSLAFGLAVLLAEAVLWALGAAVLGVLVIGAIAAISWGNAGSAKRS